MSPIKSAAPIASAATKTRRNGRRGCGMRRILAVRRVAHAGMDRRQLRRDATRGSIRGGQGGRMFRLLGLPLIAFALAAAAAPPPAPPQFVGLSVAEGL